MSRKPLDELSQSISDELFQNILPYWPRLRSGDTLIAALDIENQQIPGIDLGVIMVSRLLWTYSRAYHLFGNEEHLEFANFAKNVLLDRFEDKAHGGFYWSVDAAGQPSETKKQCYAQAFCIYAFSEHFRASGEGDSLERAYNLFHLINHKAWEPRTGGYLETFTADWKPLEKMRLGVDDLDAPKTMNNHLHIIEAFANLLMIDPSAEVKERCRTVLRVIADRILLPDKPRFGLFYDYDWQLIDPVVSPGHDIEGSWLLYEAAEIVGDTELMDEFEKRALDMADLVLKTGIDPSDRGVYDEFHDEHPHSDTKCWWPQAEAVVGFFNAYQLSGEERYLQASLSVWDYIRNVFVEKEHGEWIWGVEKDGRPMAKEKAGPWKSSYHNARACFEMIARIKAVQR